MQIVPIKLGGKAQADDERVCRILDQICDIAGSSKIILMPSARGDRTDKLLADARSSGIVSGKELAHYLLHNGEEKAGEFMYKALTSRGLRSRLVRPEDPEFFLYGNGHESPCETRDMEFVTDHGTYMNCSVDFDESSGHVEGFLPLIGKCDVVVFTPWAVRRNPCIACGVGCNPIGVIKGRGGSDGSLVGVSEILRREGYHIAMPIKVTDVPYIYDGDGARIERINSIELIEMSEASGKWPVQRYALEVLPETGLTIGVSHYDDIDKIGTHIYGRE